jgi:hypothetical protein
MRQMSKCTKTLESNETGVFTKMTFFHAIITYFDTEIDMNFSLFFPGEDLV